MSSTVIHLSPVGWWVSYRKNNWMGPFTTDAEANEAAKVIVPMTCEEYTLMRVAPWETRVIRNEASIMIRVPCPKCKGTGFMYGRCCTHCEGAMSILKRREP